MPVVTVDVTASINRPEWPIYACSSAARESFGYLNRAPSHVCTPIANRRPEETPPNSQAMTTPSPGDGVLCAKTERQLIAVSK
jgi:hypothetical protein